CSGFADCPAGSWCVDGQRFLCPIGHYGASSGLSSPNCTAACQEGFACPEGTIVPQPCTNPSQICPAGMGEPVPVKDGYFGGGGKASVAAAPTSRRAMTLYSNGLYSWEAACPRGHFCGSGRATACPRGSYTDAEGSTSCRQCPERSYCPAGCRRFRCPAGRWGASWRSTNASCDGSCSEGYYCPIGSSRPDEIPCGPWSFPCPAGYTTEDPAEDRYPWLAVAQKRTPQQLCRPGYYCRGGVRFLCAAGYWGRSWDATSAACDGACEEGYFCPEGSTSPRQKECGDESVFCPSGSAAPTPVSSGWFTTGGSRDGGGGGENNSSTGAESIPATRSGEARCEPGSWCRGGVRFLCAAGHWGGEFGQTSVSCSGACHPGHFCHEGSADPRQFACGGSHLYCPAGSAWPTPVDAGFYGIKAKNDSDGVGGGSLAGSDPAGARQWAQARAPAGSYARNGVLFSCPGGTYGAISGLSSSGCSGRCAGGFYCPPGSTSLRQEACGSPELYCPAGSAAPVAVDTGWYTSSYPTEPEREECPPGQFRNYSAAADSTAGGDAMVPTAVPLAPCRLCPAGTYKAEAGDDTAQCLPCPPYAAVAAADRVSCFCYRLPGGAAVDPLAPVLGFNTTSGTCESVTAEEAAAAPSETSLVGTALARESQHRCERGFWCFGGVRFPCPAGRYGSKDGETTPLCEGSCSAGSFCPAGSASPFEKACGGPDAYCPEGSAYPQRCPVGYSTDIDGSPPDRRRSAQPCAAGYYCTGDGSLQACPPGTIGHRPALATAACNGPCPPGFVCPAATASLADALPCGSPQVFCPAGSATPTPVLPGYYSVRGSDDAELSA
ncbi:unnamed protein product, partial [Phaeothamnion confervicola]